MSAAATIVALAVLLPACWLVGRALFVLTGARALRGVEVAFGLCALIPFAVLGIRLPGHGTTAAVLLVLVVVAAAWIARRDLTPPDAGQLLAAALALAGVALPFAAQGRFGILGVGVLDDIGSHYALADSLRENIHLPLNGTLNSYPIGPHALAGGLVTLLHTNDPAAFTALMMTAAIATALAAATALWRAPAVLRGIGGATAGLGFLLAAYYGQSAFKETLVAMCVLTFAVALERLSEEGGWRPGTVALLGLPTGAALATFGSPGPAWIVGTAAVWAVAVTVSNRRLPTARELRRAAILVGAAVAVLALVSLPQIDRLVSFDAAANATGQYDAKTFAGNLVGFLSLREALGIWPGGDFRLGPTEIGMGGVKLLSLAAAIGLACALLWDARARRFGLASGLVAALLIYAVTRRGQGPYVTAKALVMVAPLATTVLLRWLFTARAGALRVVGWSAGLGAAALMLWSSSLALRSTPIGSLNQALDLQSLKPLIKGRPVLFIGYDNFAAWELSGTQVAMLAPYSVNSSFPVELRKGKPVDRAAPVDADSVTPSTLARTSLAITSGAGFGSRLAGNWTPLRRAGLYTLWQRRGPVPDKRTLDEGGSPGAKLECPDGRPPIGSASRALVVPDPVVGSGATWTTEQGAPVAADGVGFAGVGAGGAVQQTLSLAPGEWELSLQYSGSRGIRVSAPGLARSLPANLIAAGTMWPVGTVRATGAATVVRIDVDGTTPLGRPAGVAFGAVAATRPGRDVALAAKAACGRYLDGYLTR
jgi:hypothetical protein